MVATGVVLIRDQEGQLVPGEPLYVWWSERDSPGAKKFGPQYAQPDIWRCREHPDWQGEDIPESRVAVWSERGDFPDKTEAERRAFREQESIQAHATLDGLIVAER
jgi:hypothetical protein